MKHMRIPIPTYRWLTISWGTEPAETKIETQIEIAQPTTATAGAGSKGPYSTWKKETGRTRRSWERYYQLDRIRMELMVMRSGHKAPFTQEQIVAQGDLFRRYLAQRTDPATQGRGRPRLRSI